MIFMWFLARSSRGTGPKIRVPTGLALLVHDHRGVLIEADDRAILALQILIHPNDDGAKHVTLLHATARNGFLDGDDDDVAHAGVATASAAQHLDAHDPASARVVGDFQVSLHLDHGLNLPD